MLTACLNPRPREVAWCGAGGGHLDQAERGHAAAAEQEQHPDEARPHFAARAPSAMAGLRQFTFSMSGSAQVLPKSALVGA